MPEKVVFLLRELSGYVTSSIQHWKKNSNKQVVVVFWPVHRDAPFQWSPEEGVEWIEKSEFLHSKNQPQFWQDVVHLFVAGWGDVDYNTIVKNLSNIPKTILFDTQWNESLKMKLGRFWLYFKIIRFFDFAWVPGNRQRILAEKLFFKTNHIFEGFYVGDQKLFGPINSDFKKEPNELNVIFAGRLIPEKGILPFIHAFISCVNSNPTLKMKLHICGTGPLQQDCPQSDHIVYHGFVQPKELAELFKKMNLFVLPSSYEPWGVVLHEAAFAGLPVIASDAVGSADAFVLHEKNGWVFTKNDVEEAMRYVLSFANMKEPEREKMGLLSCELAERMVLDTWSRTANQILTLSSCAE